MTDTAAPSSEYGQDQPPLGLDDTIVTPEMEMAEKGKNAPGAYEVPIEDVNPLCQNPPSPMNEIERRAPSACKAEADAGPKP